MYKEIKRLSVLLSKRSALSSFRPLQWYWFWICIFFVYGELLQQYFNVRIVPYHTFISFILYILGVVVFVLTLKTGYYKYQFEMFAWVHLTLLLVVVQSTFIAVNMFQGMIWFTLPAMLIIFNDSWAYVFGVLFGRTPLIQLSPNKTVEGFIGGLVMTLLCGFTLPVLLSKYQYFICPKYDLSTSWPTCKPNYPFVYQDYTLPTYLQHITHTNKITLLPMQLHGLVLGSFASLLGMYTYIFHKQIHCMTRYINIICYKLYFINYINLGPFGGFFASGFKRAFKVKDFGHSIPGHGGVTDRMDCQIIMGLFVFVYYFNFVQPDTQPSQIDSIINSIKSLSQPDQLTLYNTLASLVKNTTASLVK